jgi:hypothetical protein
MQDLLGLAADLLLMTASLGAAAYCMVLSRRLSRIGSFDKGIGGAIAVLSTQVDEMKTALAAAKAGSDGAGQHLNELVRQAREISAELEMMIAACHDFAETAIEVQGGSKVAERAAPPPVTVPAEPAEEVAEETESLLVFGSRRGAAEASEAVPMFRRRAAAEG